jgi:hypothetical protein
MAEQAKNSQVQQFTTEWTKLVADQVARMESGLGELTKLENKTVAQAVNGFEEAGRYAKESLAIAEKATAEWRRLMLEATKRVAAIVAPEKA